jgi:hypothetical protein
MLVSIGELLLAIASRSHPLSPERTPTLASAATRSAEAPTTYRSGDAVPGPGTYWIWHSAHRPCHPAKVRFAVFPACAQCGHRVRFQPAESAKHMPTEWLRRDPDFKYALARRRPAKIAIPP